MNAVGPDPAPLSWEGARALHPGADGRVYLDSAAVGLLSTRTRDAMTAVLAEHHEHGSVAAPAWREHAEHVRGAVARLVGGAAERVAFTQNTSTGLATVVNGVGWRDGDNIVVPAGEFPSNLYPWLQLRGRGVEVRAVPMSGGRAELDTLRAAIDRRTRVLTVSAVQYSSGHRYDLAALATICGDADALLVVDGTQAVGAMTVDADAFGIDALAVSAHKWLLGPQGIGFLHLSPRAAERLAPSVVGWRSVADPFAFAPEPVLAEDARRYESGTENSVGIAGLGATVDLVLHLGRRRVQDRVLDRVERLADLLRRAGLTAHLAADRARRSGILIAARPGTPHATLHAALLAAGVRCSLRGGGVRLAPHYFTTDRDLADLDDALTRLS